MPVEYIIYIPIVIAVFIYLLPKAENKAFLGIFLLWLFGSPIFLNPRYMISLSFFGFDIQPNRFLFLALTPILILRVITPRHLMIKENPDKPAKLRLYEFALIGYIFSIVLAVILNFRHMGSRAVIADISNAMTFAVVYFCSKQFTNKQDFNLFRNAVLIFAAISAVVSIYQFFVNPEFFRLGAVRGAFSSYYRSNGLFTAEYDQGLFLVLSTIVAASMDMKWWVRYPFIAIAGVGVFLTMHRLSWVALVLILGMIWYFYLRKNLLTYILVPLMLVILVIFALNVPWSRLAVGRFGYKLLTNRILSDTLTGRFSQYDFALDMFSEYPFGVGSYIPSFYTFIAYNHGIPLMSKYETKNVQAYIVHNGFLSSGVKYGILGLITFFSFIFSSIVYFLKNSIQKGRNWYPHLMIILTFAVLNLTNDFSFIGTQIGVALAWILGVHISSVKQSLLEGITA